MSWRENDIISHVDTKMSDPAAVTTRGMLIDGATTVTVGIQE